MSRDPRRRIWVVGLALAVAMVPALAFASHPGGFEDVPDDHTFHDDIAWMQETGVTRGCNPPENDEFCPNETLLRGQEAAFFHRYDTYLRESIESRLVPEDCEEGQIAEFDGEAWQCADRAPAPTEDGVSLAAGEPVDLEPAETDTVVATCAEGETAVSGSVSPTNEELDVVGPTISNGEVSFEVTNNGAEAQTVTAYAICTSA